MGLRPCAVERGELAGGVTLRPVMEDELGNELAMDEAAEEAWKMPRRGVRLCLPEDLAIQAHPSSCRDNVRESLPHLCSCCSALRCSSV